MAQVYLNAVLAPPRSLSPRGFDRVMLALGVLSVSLGIIFLIRGAYPVVGFMGLEVLVLWRVFHLSFRAQTARTYVRITAEDVTVRNVDRFGRERLAQMSCRFTRVELDRTASGPHALRLKSSDRAYALGEFLTPRERESFARRLDQALSEARRERYLGDIE